MYAKLTNAVDLYKGQPIYINPKHVSAVYEVAKTPGGSLVTIIYGGFQGLAWEVEEGLTEAIAVLTAVGTSPTVLPAIKDTLVVKELVVTDSTSKSPKKAPAAKKKVIKSVDSVVQ